MGFLKARSSEEEGENSRVDGTEGVGFRVSGKANVSRSIWPLDVVRAVGWAEEQGLRDSMEDGMLAIENFGGQRGAWLLAVYDGHGGRQTVEFLLSHLHREIWKEVCSRAFKTHDALLRNAEWRSVLASVEGHSLPCPLALCSDEDVALALSTAFKSTDEALLRAGIQESGATACVCLLRPRLFGTLKSVPSVDDACLAFQIHTAHLGDTRALLIFNDGSCKRLTSSTDHKASALEEMTRVESVGGYVIGERVNGMLAIGRAFGDWTLKLGPQALRLAPRKTLQEIPKTLVVSNVPDVSTTQLFPPLPSNHAKEHFTFAETTPAAFANDNNNNNNNNSNNNSCTAEEAKQTRLVHNASRSSSSPSSIHGGEGGTGEEPSMLLLGCDGLFDVCEDRVVASIALGVLSAVAKEELNASEADAAEAVARVLVKEAIDLRGSGDNVSVAVALLQPLAKLRNETYNKTSNLLLTQTAVSSSSGSPLILSSNNNSISNNNNKTFDGGLSVKGATSNSISKLNNEEEEKGASFMKTRTEAHASSVLTAQEVFLPPSAAVAHHNFESDTSESCQSRGMSGLVVGFQGTLDGKLCLNPKERQRALLANLQRRQLLSPPPEEVDEASLLRSLKEHQFRLQETRPSTALP